MKPSEEVAKILLKIKAVELRPNKPFKYVSGILSPIYTDNRLLMSHPKERRRVVELLANKVKKIGKPDVIAGTATAGIPHAAWIAEKLNSPMIYTRSQVKVHGKGRQVEGELKKGQSVIIVEDLVSTGKSGLETLAVIKEAGGKCKDVVAIFSYELPQSFENYKKAKANLNVLCTLKELVDVAIKTSYIKEKDKEIVLDWAKDPVGWGRRAGFE
ncbi:MAG: orotate phosphoribosyltransferase [Candidatus Woykebacteria bacterium]